MSGLINLTGQSFGRLTVIEKATKRCNGQSAMWICKCDCGNTIVVRSGDLRSGKTKSCGCLRKEITSAKRKTHGKSNSRLFSIWCAVKKRCMCETDKQYKDYGGRGITICDEWKDDFQTFYDWAVSNGYEEHLTIDRIDVNGNYEPFNCKWSTEKEQSNNKRNNRLLTFNGKTQTLKQWSDETGIQPETIHYRLKRGWDLERALTLTPSYANNNKNFDVFLKP